MITSGKCSTKIAALILFVLLLGFNLKTQAQEKNEKTYQIKDKGNVTNIQPYIDAMDKADMTNHRLRDQRHTITFKTGLTIELFSANELIENGYNIQPANYATKFTSPRKEPVFDIAANDFIIEYHTSGQKHH
jgi:hypothetical protein